MENTVQLNLKDGRVIIEMRPDLAPNHVERIKEFVREGFYDGAAFHRVIAGFMAQTGDPTGSGSGRSDKPNLTAEFSDERHVRGSVSMARSGSPDSANCQFFICFADAPWLDGQYSLCGKVVSGMEHIDALKKGNEGANGTVDDPDCIVSMVLGSAKG